VNEEILLEARSDIIMVSMEWKRKGEKTSVSSEEGQDSKFVVF
jgi:hypothetical protein